MGSAFAAAAKIVPCLVARGAPAWRRCGSTTKPVSLTQLGLSFLFFRVVVCFFIGAEPLGGPRRDTVWIHRNPPTPHTSFGLNGFIGICEQKLRTRCRKDFKTADRLRERDMFIEHVVNEGVVMYEDQYSAPPSPGLPPLGFAAFAVSWPSRRLRGQSGRPRYDGETRSGSPRRLSARPSRTESRPGPYDSDGTARSRRVNHRRGGP